MTLRHKNYGSEHSFQVTTNTAGLISSQSDEQAEGKSITDLERIRDDNLVEIQKALEKNDYGAGTLIKKAKETFETL